MNKNKSNGDVSTLREHYEGEIKKYEDGITRHYVHIQCLETIVKEQSDKIKHLKQELVPLKAKLFGLSKLMCAKGKQV